MIEREFVCMYMKQCEYYGEYVHHVHVHITDPFRLYGRVAERSGQEGAGMCRIHTHIKRFSLLKAQKGR